MMCIDDTMPRVVISKSHYILCVKLLENARVPRVGSRSDKTAFLHIKGHQTSPVDYIDRHSELRLDSLNIITRSTRIYIIYSSKRQSGPD